MFAVLMVALAADPQFVVVNKCPTTFTVVNKCAAPAVAAKTFRGGSYHAGHNCPNCGAETTKISNDDGPNHTHVCTTPNCNTWWYHVDAVSSGGNLKVVRRLFGR